ncbi:unnamed protein product [Cochlearia groenlandica]
MAQNRQPDIRYKLDGSGIRFLGLSVAECFYEMRTNEIHQLRDSRQLGLGCGYLYISINELSSLTVGRSRART